MGVHMNALNNNDSEYITAVEFIKATIGLRVRTPLHWYDFVFDKTPTGRKYNDFIKLTHAFTDKVWLHLSGSFNRVIMFLNANNHYGFTQNYCSFYSFNYRIRFRISIIIFI